MATPEMMHFKDRESRDANAVAQVLPGQVVQMPDGQAAYFSGQNVVDVGGRFSGILEGAVTVIKTAGITILDGGDVYWDVSANAASYKADPASPDFYIGTAVGDAASAATSMKVRLNDYGRYRMNLERGGIWISEQTLGLGVSMLPGGGTKLAFSTTSEAAQAAVYSLDSIPVTAAPILEFVAAVYDIGNGAALDMDIGLASGSHATDFESVTYFVAIHFDGSDLSIKVHSDDNTTDVAPVDTLIDAVDDTYFEGWIDCRNPANVRVYINGVDVVPLGTTLVLTGAGANGLKPIVMTEKTTSTVPADIRIAKLRVRTAGEGA